MEQFTTDLASLEKMIGTTPPQTGGAKKKSKRKKSPARKTKKKSPRRKKSPKRKSKSKRKKGGAKNTRNFKVMEVNGKAYPHYRLYTGAEPKDAALKAFHWVCVKLGEGKACKITFTLKETTRGSTKRLYGPYKGRYEKLPKEIPIVIKQKTGKNKTIGVRTHKRVVELVRKK